MRKPLKLFLIMAFLFIISVIMASSANIPSVSDLPVVGGSDGTWGTELNNLLTNMIQFLNVSHKPDGNLKPNQNVSFNELNVSSLPLGYHNLTDLPTCAGTDKYTFDGTDIVCIADAVGSDGQPVGSDNKYLYNITVGGVNIIYYNDTYGNLTIDLRWGIHNTTLVNYIVTQDNSVRTSIDDNISNIINNGTLNKSIDLSTYLKSGGTLTTSKWCVYDGAGIDCNVEPVTDTTVNKTTYVELIRLNLTTWQSPDGALSLTMSDDGSDLFLTSNVEGNNRFVIATTGTFFEIIANPNAGNDYLMASITETQGDDTQILFYEGGTGRNRFFDTGSARFGGTSGSDCTILDTRDFADCDTAGTGADVIIQDTLVALGNIVTANGSINLTDSGEIFTNATIWVNGKAVNSSIDLSTYFNSIQYPNLDTDSTNDLDLNALDNNTILRTGNMTNIRESLFNKANMTTAYPNLDTDSTNDFDGAYSSLTGVPDTNDLAIVNTSMLDNKTIIRQSNTTWVISTVHTITSFFSNLNFTTLIDTYIPNFYNKENYTAEYSATGYKKANLTTDYPNLDTDSTDDFDGDFYSLANTPAYSNMQLSNITDNALTWRNWSMINGTSTFSDAGSQEATIGGTYEALTITLSNTALDDQYVRIGDFNINNISNYTQYLLSSSFNNTDIIERTINVTGGDGVNATIYLNNSRIWDNGSYICLGKC